MRELEPEAVEAAFEEERRGTGNFYRLPDHEGEALEPHQIEQAIAYTALNNTLLALRGLCDDWVLDAVEDVFKRNVDEILRGEQ